MINYKIGDQVICIDATNYINKPDPNIAKGQVYIVSFNTPEFIYLGGLMGKCYHKSKFKLFEPGDIEKYTEFVSTLKVDEEKLTI